MGQIVKRKKKGRPSKADLAHRSGSPARAPESDIRRSLRRRNVRYNIDYDDYLDEDEEDEIEEERRREKKLKLVLKLNQSQTSAESPAPSRAPSAARGRRGAYDEEEERVEEEEEEDEECEKKPVKKRRINGVDDDEEDDDEDGDHGDDDEEERGRKRAKGRDSGPGTPCDPSTGIPMPDKKSLELILDKLQKKDTYGVYAEPVDPEELPDYHDVIAHPMDFATVRKKLANGSYSILEQLENDVFLICSNAMQYNAADTIYYKQARSIQELARKKFEKIRIDIDRSEKELKSEQKVKSTFLLKKQAKKPLSRAIQEPVGSDFSSGATLATAGDVQNGPIATQAGGSERPSNTDVLVEGNSSLADNNLEKAEELSSGKGLLSKFGRKLYAADENRRATYNISNQPVVRSDSIFATFEGEIKQFVAVGLHAENSYARSLARFAATLGPVAWKVASQRIEQALPSGCKFGRGWVGEYEPLPTPVLMLETRAQKESPLFTKLQCTADVPKDNVPVKIPAPTKEQPTSGPNLEGKPSFLRPATGHASDGKPSFVVSPGIKSNSPFNAIKQPQNPHSRTFVEPENKVCKQVELNFPPLTSDKNADIVSERNPGKSGTIAFRSREMVTKNMALQQSAALKQLDNNGVTNGGLPNGKVASNSLNTRLVSSSSDAVPNQMAQAATFFSHMQGQGLSDPVQLMRMLTEKAQKQQNSSSQPPIDCPSAMPSVSSVKRDDSSNAAAAAARAWMSIGAGGCKQGTENSSGLKSQISVESLYNPAREFHSQISRIRAEFPLSAGMQFSPESNNFPLQGFPAQPVCATNEAQFQNRPMIFPQLVTADLSRFQMQSPWRGLSPHVQPRQKKETLPPDLNIGFQSPGSPVKQSSGMLVDSQQPDLALQL